MKIELRKLLDDYVRSWRKCVDTLESSPKAATLTPAVASTANSLAKTRKRCVQETDEGHEQYRRHWKTERDST